MPLSRSFGAGTARSELDSLARLGLGGGTPTGSGGAIEDIANDIMNMNRASAPVPAPTARGFGAGTGRSELQGFANLGLTGGTPKSSGTTTTQRSTTSSILPDASSLAGTTFPISDPVVTEPAAPVIPTATSDATYQQQMADLARAMADYENQLNLENSQYGNQYNESLNMLGWRGDPTTGNFDWSDRSGFAGQAINSNKEDFASRGLFNSGLFEKANGDIMQDYAKRKTGFDTSRQDFLSGQEAKKQTYSNQKQSTETQALMEAIARIAAQYQIDPNLVPKGI